MTNVIQADLGKVAHAFVVGAKKLKAAVIWAAQTAQKDAPQIAEAEALAENIAEKIYPKSATVDAAIQASVSKVFNAVDAAGDAATANGLNIQLDDALISAVKAALPTVKAQAATTPGS